MKKVIGGIALLITVVGLFSFANNENQFEISRNLNVFTTLHIM